MTIWRPVNSISVKALALIWRDDALLVTEVFNDLGQATGVRPLGGTVEFGEPWRDALQREFLEELGARITLSDKHFVMENLYEHQGTLGHEIVFLCPARFDETTFYQRNSFDFLESDESSETARWVTLEELSLRQLELYPAGLRQRLENLDNALRDKRLFS
ncbi:NUDIX domain-containing protein [Rhodobacterales bacterium]|nr:NUDIX domain-containing protein [Rhodobacterales bacterium]